MRTIYLDWNELKSEFLTKNFIINQRQIKDGYEVFILDRNILWTCNVINSSEKSDFEANYKDKCNPSLYSEEGKEIVRAESRPIGYNTFFTCQGDSTNNIGDGKKLSWDFSNSDDEISVPSGSNYKTKQIIFAFLDGVYLKEGTIYWQNAQKESFIDIQVMCPQGYYYLDNNGTPTQAEEDTVIHKFTNHHMFFGDCPMGDELNTEACSSEIPSYMKYILEITVPITDNLSNGHVSVELYRKRSVIL